MLRGASFPDLLSQLKSLSSRKWLWVRTWRLLRRQSWETGNSPINAEFCEGSVLASLNSTNLRNRLSGLFWVGFSAFICIESFKSGIGTFGRPGAGFLPFWSALILGMLATVLVIKSIAVRRARSETVQFSRKGKREKVILTLAILLVYTLFMERVGYLVSTFVLMVVLYKIAGRRLWMQVLRAVVTVFATYIVFHVWLGVQLPNGILSF